MPMNHASTKRRAALCEFAVVLLSMSAAFALRTWPAAGAVFTTAGVSFQETDAWYHVRRVEHLVHHFPHVIRHDPYALAPDGQEVAVAPLLDWMAAGAALLLGDGAPSADLVHRVCAWLPASLGALIVPCVYGLARGLFGRGAGTLAAAIIATLPGPFLSRSMLGYFDHHVAEVLFSTLTMLALLAALRCAARAGSAADSALEANPVSIARLLLLSVSAGIALGCYLLSWVGGSLLVLVIFAAVVFQLLSEHFRSRNTATPLLGATLPCFLTAGAMVAPCRDLPGFDLHVAALAGGTIGVIALATASLLLRRIRVRDFWIIPASAALLATCIGLAWIFAPGVCDRVLSMVRAFAAGRSASTISEAAPLPAATLGTLFTSLWIVFTINGFLAIAALAALWVAVSRRGRADHTLLVVWTTLSLLAMLQQRRFACYAAINVAVLSPVAVMWATHWIRSRFTGASRSRAAWTAAGAIAAMTITVAPNVPLALRTAREDTGPSRDWLAALDWLRAGTPEPFGDPAYYLARYDASPRRPMTAGVMCWWDDGYGIIQRARRVPVANPTQAGAVTAARFFTASDESAAAEIMRAVRATHVVIDQTLPLWATDAGRRADGKFRHVPFWAGAELSTYVESILLRTDAGRLEPVTVYYPAYYRTMCARLYTFGADAFTPANATWLIAVEDARDAEGRRIIRERRRFETHAAAVEYATGHPDEPWQLVGFTPYRSCVPLEKLERFRRVYHSPAVAAARGDRTVSEVEIFEFAPPEP
jgi:dolichyl-diphosphooligosaccharide--protein glycosyltransferase